MFKIFVNKIIPGKTAVEYLWESDDLNQAAEAMMLFREKIAELKRDAGIFFGFGDALEVVLEKGRRGSSNDPTLGGFWLVKEVVAKELLQF